MIDGDDDRNRISEFSGGNSGNVYTSICFIPVLPLSHAHFHHFPISGRTLGLKRKQPLLRNHQIGQTKQGIQLRRVLGQTAVTHLLQPQQILDNVKRVCSTLARMLALSRSMPSSRRPNSVSGRRERRRRFPGRNATCQVADPWISGRFSTP